MDEVLNQAPALEGYDLFASDRALCEAVEREGAGWAREGLSRFGRTLGSADVIELGVLAEKNPPKLKAFDRWGRRLDEVEFHPAWHGLMRLAVGEGLHTSPWAEPKAGAHVARAAGFYLMGQVDAGVLCPMAMTYGAVPALKHAPKILEAWKGKLFSREYDPTFRPIAEKSSALMGMGMTEKQGGSDLRTNLTRAEPDGEAYRITGDKWFFSAPMCDAFLVLAQASEGLSCFFMPRWTPDGERNAMRIQRLKDKLGDRSNASSEMQFESAWALPVGEPGRGIATIIEMATYTRLDCVVGSAGIMRAALAQAINHASGRTAFQKRLIDQPLMTNVLADLALESEAATALGMRLARAFDAGDDPAEGALRRLLTPAAKYWVCKRTPPMVAEAVEVMGGNGFVEEGPMPRLYRQAPLNSIWEGSGNVMALDTLRALGKSPQALDAVEAELAPARGANAALDRSIDGVLATLRSAPQEADARRLCEALALAMQGALLVRFAPAALANGFCASRLGGESGRAFGALPSGVDVRAIVERANPLN
jgi:putative acyl-CoA dehydrogenase